MDNQSIAYLIVYAFVIGFGILLLFILRGVVQWWLGTAEIISLLKEQNDLLKQRTATTPPAVQSAQSQTRPNPLTGSTARRPEA